MMVAIESSDDSSDDATTRCCKKYIGFRRTPLAARVSTTLLFLWCNISIALSVICERRGLMQVQPLLFILMATDHIVVDIPPVVPLVLLTINGIALVVVVLSMIIYNLCRCCLFLTKTRNSEYSNTSLLVIDEDRYGDRYDCCEEDGELRESPLDGPSQGNPFVYNTQSPDDHRVLYENTVDDDCVSLAPSFIVR
jgi:hypothetical protein